jgi:hypothetical protein
MNREERSHTHETGSHIDELLQGLEERRRTCQSLADAPELRMVHDIRSAYQTEAHEDARSLERVLAKLLEDQARTHSKPFFHRSVSREPERLSTMQHILDIPYRSKSGRIWQRPAGLLAAVLFLALLVGVLLTALGVVHVGESQPTAGIASQLITSVNLSDSVNQVGQAPPVQHFTVGQTIGLLINVGKMKGPAGVLTVKWYENNRLYATSTHDIQAPKGKAIATAERIIPVRTHQVFTQPGEGKVELYWNGQLVKTLHFVVEQK